MLKCLTIFLCNTSAHVLDYSGWWKVSRTDLEDFRGRTTMQVCCFLQTLLSRGKFYEC